MLGRTFVVGLFYASALAGCGSDKSPAAPDGGSGSSGTAGSAGSAGSASGSAGTGGSAGAGGSGGASGSAAASGSGGTAGADDGGTLDGTTETDGGAEAGALLCGPSAGRMGSVDSNDIRCDASPASFPEFDRACWDDFWCVVALHQVDCCGTVAAVGILHPEEPCFNAAEQICKSEYPLCRCAAGPIRTDTGQTATDASQIKVQCRSGLCTTYVP